LAAVVEGRNDFGCAVVIDSNIGSRGRTTRSKSGFGSENLQIKIKSVFRSNGSS
jgi:hypothetical protein